MIIRFSKRMFGLIVTMLVMVGTISLPALASPTVDNTKTGKLTIQKTDQDGNKIKGAVYAIYKIADITQSGGELIYDNSNCGHNVTVTSSTKVSDFDGITLSALRTGTTDGVNNLVFNDLPLGVYLVKETTTPAGVSASNDFIVSIPMTSADGTSWVYDVTAEPKNTVSGSVSKIITNGGLAEEGTKVWTVNVGEEITYQINVTMPDDFYGAATGAKAYTQFDVNDSPPAGLNINVSSVVVMAGTTDVTNNVNIQTTATGFTVNLVNATQDGSAHSAIAAGATVSITYKATATLAGLGEDITNVVKAQYNYNGLEESGTIEPTDSNPILHTYSHAALKVDEDGVALNGAQFVVKLKNGNYLQVKGDKSGWIEVANQSEATVFTSGGTNPLTNAAEKPGYISIIGVRGQDHQIIEIKAPDEYTLLAAPVDVTFNQQSTDTQATGGYTTTVVNEKGFTLPGTGGAGIFIYIAAGILLVAIGLVLYAKKRR